MSSIKTAVIGCGIAGPELHMPVLSAHPKAELVAICDEDTSRLHQAAARFPSARKYLDYETLLEEEELDSVHACIPPNFHVDIAKKYLPAGVPILFEKPCATTKEDIKELQELSEIHETATSVVHNRLFEPQLSEALNRVQDGEIGDVVSVTFVYAERQDLSETARKDWVFKLPGGELGEGIVHQVYLPLAFVDSVANVQSVSVHNFEKYDSKVSMDGASITIEDSESRFIDISITTSAEDGAFLHVYGTEGQLVVPRNMVGSYILQDDSILSNSLTFSTDILKQLSKKFVIGAIRRGRSIVTNSPDIKNTGHYRQINKHINSIETGSSPPVSLDSAYDSVWVLEELDSHRERVSP